MTGKTSDNEIFTILRCFIPNEQAWIFRWLLLTALPLLLGKDLERINMIISDGDSQEIAQINNLINLLQTPAKRHQCAWHVVDRSWNRFVYSVPKAGKKFRRKLLSYSETSRKIIFQWLYSWMTRACKTVAEYNVSYLLFVHYLESESLLKKLGEEVVESIKAMFRKAVYPHQTNFVFHLRQNLFAFEEYTNSTQEASFSAVKHGPSALTSNMDLDTAVNKLNQQASSKTSGYQASALSRLANTAPWSTIESVVSKMVPYGGGLIQSEWDDSFKDYSSGMFGEKQFRLALDVLKGDDTGMGEETGVEEEALNVPSSEDAIFHWRFEIMCKSRIISLIPGIT